MKRENTNLLDPSDLEDRREQWVAHPANSSHSPGREYRAIRISVRHPTGLIMDHNSTLRLSAPVRNSGHDVIFEKNGESGPR